MHFMENVYWYNYTDVIRCFFSLCVVPVPLCVVRVPLCVVPVQKLTQAFSHRLSRLESRLVKTERVHGLFESLRAFLRGAEETKLVDETSRLPADVSVIDHKIVEISSLGDRMEDGFVLLGDATSSFEDLQADIEEDEIVPAGGDETDAPGPVSFT